MLEEVEPDHGRYLARSISAVEEIRLSEVRLSVDQWQEIGKEIKQPHNKLRRLSLIDINFNNTEFAMFCRSKKCNKKQVASWTQKATCFLAQFWHDLGVDLASRGPHQKECSL